MRFLLEFVTCCGSPSQLPPEPLPPVEDEERWFVPVLVGSTSAAAASRRRKKHGKSNSLDWRPSLGPISEDIVAPPRKPPTGAVVSTVKDVKKRTAAAGGSKVFRRSYSEGYHGSSSSTQPMIMPAFSPTPFMF